MSVNRILGFSFMVENLAIFLLTNSPTIRAFLILWSLSSLGIFKLLQPRPALAFPFRDTDVHGLAIQSRMMEEKMLGEKFMASLKRSSIDPTISCPTMIRGISDNLRCDTWKKKTRRRAER